MELIPPGTNIDFVRLRFAALGLSVALAMIGIISLIVKGGPNYGVDFTGGTVAQVRFHTHPHIDEIRSALSALGMESLTIQDFSDTFSTNADAKSEFLLRLPLAEGRSADISNQIKEALKAKFGENEFEILRMETVGPRVGSALRQQAILAVLFSTIMISIYVAVRFELRFGFGAAIALLHDVVISLGCLSLFNYEVDLTVVAALLTIVGFSVHDTVVISDRIRENMHKNRREPLTSLINRSINETLSRSVITTGTAILVVLALFILGGNVIRGFAFALLTGFIFGTYSSIYVAAPIVILFEGTRFAGKR